MADFLTFLFFILSTWNFAWTFFRARRPIVKKRDSLKFWLLRPLISKRHFSQKRKVQKRFRFLQMVDHYLSNLSYHNISYHIFKFGEVARLLIFLIFLRVTQPLHFLRYDMIWYDMIFKLGNGLPFAKIETVFELSVFEKNGVNFTYWYLRK